MSTKAATELKQAINDPAPDFATIAAGFGWWSEGPVTDPSQVRSGGAARR